jgi:predicted ATPase
VLKPPRIVLTGGPGAGKTAVLELARRELCEHVEVLPEAASIVFGGGFPRYEDEVGKRSAQRTIYHVQSELEIMLLLRRRNVVAAIGLCDRGTLDALAYWPGDPQDFFREMQTTLDAELARYAAVLHLRVPESAAEYKQSHIRRESYTQARAIDDRLLDVWSTHPRRVIINGSKDFLFKAEQALRAIRAEVPTHVCGRPGRQVTIAI